MISLSVLGFIIKSVTSQSGISRPLAMGSTESIEGLSSLIRNITPPESIPWATPIEDLPWGKTR